MTLTILEDEQCMSRVSTQLYKDLSLSVSTLQLSVEDAYLLSHIYSLVQDDQVSLVRHSYYGYMSR